MKRAVFVLFIVVFVLVGTPQAAGSLACTLTSNQYINTYVCAWTSSSGGAVSGNAFTVNPGTIIQVKFKPGASGSQPTDLYDVTLVDTDGIDVLAGAGANLSQTTGSYLVANTPPLLPAQTTLDLVVANAGNVKSGTVVIVIDQLWRR